MTSAKKYFWIVSTGLNLAFCGFLLFTSAPQTFVGMVHQMVAHRYVLTCDDLSIDLPQNPSAQVDSEASPVILYVQSNGLLTLNDSDETFVLAELGARLDSSFKTQKDRILYLKSDPSVRYDLISKVMNAGETAGGVERVVFITNATDKEPKNQ